jgi:hypothetical protein
VARHYASRQGEKEGREPAFAMGSTPPPMYDELLDRHVERLISDMHRGGMSLGSLVANRVVIDEWWELLSDEARHLLEAKYVEGWSAKGIADRLKVTPGTVDNKLWKARLAAREVLLDDIDDLRG